MRAKTKRIIFIVLMIFVFVTGLVEYLKSKDEKATSEVNTELSKTTETGDMQKAELPEITEHKDEQIAPLSDREKVKEEVYSELSEKDLDYLQNGSPEDKAALEQKLEAEIEKRMRKDSKSMLKVLTKEERNKFYDEKFGNSKSFADTKFKVKTDN